MASRDVIEGCQNVLTCSICLAHLTDPMATSCGHSVCQSCLSGSSEASQPISCCRCQEISQSRAFNDFLRRRGKRLLRKGNLLSLNKINRSLRDPANVKNTKRIRNLFCMNDQTLLCASCSQSQEHEAHTIRPIEEAAKVYRKKLHENLKLVNVHSKDVQKLMLEEKISWAWAVVWTEQLEMSREMFEEKFQEMSEFLSDEEEEVHSDAEETLNKSESLLLQRPEPFTPKLNSSYCMDLKEFLSKFQESR